MDGQFESLLGANCPHHRGLAVSHRAGKMRRQHCMSDGPGGRPGYTAARNATRDEDGQIDDRGSDLEILHSCPPRHCMPKKTPLWVESTRASPTSHQNSSLSPRQRGKWCDATGQIGTCTTYQRGYTVCNLSSTGYHERK